jgi:diguanylate cyclase (GGDEF)-like protein
MTGDRTRGRRSTNRIEEGETTLELATAPLDSTTIRAYGPLVPDATTGTREVARHDTPNTIVLPDVPRPDRATLTVLAGPDGGATFSMTETEITIGRSAHADVPINEASVSRHHAKIAVESEGRYVLEDLGSTNGTFVGGRRVRRASLRPGDRIQLGRATVLRFSIVDEMEDAMQRRLYETASRDTLTGLANRRTLFERLAAEVAYAAEHQRDVGLLMIDVDHFKRVNDTFGHLAGDQVLKAVSLAGAQALRDGDVLARYGGEEFAAIARGVDRDAAAAIAERFREAIADVRVEVGGGSVALTVSIGVAVFSECTRWANGLDLVALADERLYLAKNRGRDRVCAGT